MWDRWETFYSMNKTSKHQSLVIENQIFAPFDIFFKQIKNGFSKFWNRAHESEVEVEAAAPFVFNKKENKKYPFVSQNRTISTNVHAFLLQNQSFRVSGRPEFPNFVLQAFNFHYLYQKHIICEGKWYHKHTVIWQVNSTNQVYKSLN